MRRPKGSPSRRLGLGLAGVVSIFFLLSVCVGFIYRSSQVMQQQTHIQSPTPRLYPSLVVVVVLSTSKEMDWVTVTALVVAKNLFSFLSLRSLHFLEEESACYATQCDWCLLALASQEKD